MQPSLHLIPEHFHYPQRSPVPTSSHSPSPLSPHQSQVTTNVLLSLWIHLFWIFHRNGIIHHLASCVWLLYLSIVFSRFIPVVAFIDTSFLLWLNNTPLCEHTLYPLKKLMNIFGLFLLFSCFKWCYYDHLCTHVFNILGWTSLLSSFSFCGFLKVLWFLLRCLFLCFCNFTAIYYIEIYIYLFYFMMLFCLILINSGKSLNHYLYEYWLPFPHFTIFWGPSYCIIHIS